MQSAIDVHNDDDDDDTDTQIPQIGSRAAVDGEARSGGAGIGRRGGIGANEYFSRLSLGGERTSGRTLGDINGHDDDVDVISRRGYPWMPTRGSLVTAAE